MYYKLSDYAKKFNVTYRTAWNRFNRGQIKDAYVDETGHVCIPVPTIDNNVVFKTAALYARVSNNDAKENLERQLERLSGFAATNGFMVKVSVKEIGSGLNDNRSKLISLLNNDDWNYLIVENKDRLTRFGFNYLNCLLKKMNKEIIVINDIEDKKQDLIQDLVSIIYSFSARIYGLRKAKNKQKEIIDLLEK
jgi:predicted site-specific integrase-resolvase